jgi:exodeoxyribonuclease VII large subunit
MAVPVRADLLNAVDSLARRELACWWRGQEARRNDLRAAMRALPGAQELLALPSQRLDHAAARLPRALIANARLHHNQFSRTTGRFGPHILRTRMQRCAELTAALAERARRADAVARLRRRERLKVATQRLAAGLKANAQAHAARITGARERAAALAQRARRAIATLLRRQAAVVERDGQLLAALSHRGVLARGFALVRDQDGKPLRAAAAVSPGMPVDIEFSDGQIHARAESGASGPGPRATDAPPKPRNRQRDDKGQGSLFG